jgi:hypothetical protein
VSVSLNPSARTESTTGLTSGELTPRPIADESHWVISCCWRLHSCFVGVALAVKCCHGFGARSSTDLQFLVTRQIPQVMIEPAHRIYVVVLPRGVRCESHGGRVWHWLRFGGIDVVGSGYLAVVLFVAVCPTLFA